MPQVRPEKHAVEFHDSEIVSVSKRGTTLELTLAAYLHCEEAGRKTGWSQNVVMRLGNGSAQISPSTLPSWIIDGDMAVDERTFVNCIDLPFQSQGKVRFYGITHLGERFEFNGDSVQMETQGDAEYVEEVPF